jgi:HEAT repeat protein
MQRLLGLAAALAFGLTAPPASRAQTPDVSIGDNIAPSTLGQRIKEFPHITVLEVAQVNRAERSVLYRKVADLKGKDTAQEIKHVIQDLPPRDLQAIFDWARPGKVAICFHDGLLGKTCLGNFWYGCGVAPPTWWMAYAPAPHWNSAYIGSVVQLRAHVTAILAGREVVVTSEAWEAIDPYTSENSPVYRDWLHGQKGRVRRVKASLKIDRPDLVWSERSRNFVGWGVGGPEVVPALTVGLGDKDSRLRAEAAEDLGQIGRAARSAIPRLRRSLRDPDGRVRIHAATALARIEPGNPVAIAALVKTLKSQDDNLRAAAAAALGELRAPSRFVISALQEVLLHDRKAEVRSVTVFALGQIGAESRRPEKAAVMLAQALKHDRDGHVRSWSVRALRSLGPAGKVAIPVLRRALNDANVSVSMDAADVLARLGTAALPALVEALKDVSCSRRDLVASYLGEMGPKAIAAAPPLIELLRNSNPWMRLVAARALIGIDRQRGVQTALPILSRLVSKGNRAHRIWTIADLERLGPQAQAAVPALVEALQDNNSDIRIQAVNALSKIGPGARQALPALYGLLKDGNGNLRGVAAEALWRIARRAEPSVHVLTQLWNQGDTSGVRTHAAAILGEMGPSARAALPELKKALHDKNDSLRGAMALACWRIESREALGGMVFDARPRTLAVLIELLDSPDSLVRTWAAIYLRQIGREAATAVSPLLKATKDREPSVRQCAIEALGCIRPESGAVLTALRTALEDDDVGNRFAAAEASCQMGHADRVVIAELVRIASMDLAYWPEAARVLGNLGPGAKAAVPSLLRTLTHEYHDIYLSAARALRKIDPATANQRGIP